MRNLPDRLARLERTADSDRPETVISIPHNGRGAMPPPSETWLVMAYDPAA